MGPVSRVVAAALLAGVMHAGDARSWAPAAFPGDWHDPRTLELAANTPINCLLVPWSAGADAGPESDRHRRAEAYARAAHGRGIAVLGLVPPGADPRRAAASAVAAGLDGVLLEDDFSDPAWPALITRDAVTPRIRAASESDAVDATPTSEPWIDSNLWLVRSRRARGGNRPVWLGHALENPSGDDYARAIAEAAAAGGRWVVAPDQALVAGLWRGEPGARSTWRRIVAALEFQRKHSEWRAFQPLAALGVIQDRAAADTDMSDENLKLICRRRIPYRVIERADLTAAALQGLKVVLAADLAPPTAGERKLLAAFAGDGRTVVYNEQRTDPDSLSNDLLDLVDIQDLPVRLFNVPSVLPQAAASRDGARLVVELINYATAPAELIVVRVAGDYRVARLVSPDTPPVDLNTRRSGGRTEVRIAGVAVYAAVVFEK